FYAYLLENEGRQGIINSWDECKSIVSGKKAKYKSFPNEVEAQQWLNAGAHYENKKEKKVQLKMELQNGLYFDAGTGRGIGVEVRLTDKEGNSLLGKLLPEIDITEHGNYLTPAGSTNNYGELLGLSFAIDLAIRENIYHIFGDSNLVIVFWSKGFVRREKIKQETLDLIDKVILQRKYFESLGGKIEHVSGDINPADLGFHK
ncbi:MAG: viroplasmin family protein, partial [Cetobacterium sp.]